MTTLDEILAFLKADRMKYVVHLKMLEAYAPVMTWISEPAGVALLLPTTAHAYDASTYPDSDWIVFLAVADAGTAGRLAMRLPRDQRLVFKLVDELSKRAVVEAFPVRRITSFVSYTLREGAFPPDPLVKIAAALDPRLVPCYQSNGYSLTELEHSFSQGSLSFSLFSEDGQSPLTTCFIFKNYGPIWEIGGVYTHPAHRRQGLARRVVAAAAQELLSSGRIPRYQVKETNLASLALAEHLGMQRFVTTEHFAYMPENSSTDDHI